MLKSGYALLGLLVAALGLLAVETLPSTARTPPPPPTTQPPSAAANGESTKAARVNNWTIGIAAGLLEGSFIRFAAELAKAFDDGENLRILPVVTYGASENITDLLYLRGVDIAITHADVFDFYKKSGAVKNIEQRINYISQMHNTEFYVLACSPVPMLRTCRTSPARRWGFTLKDPGRA